MTNTLITPFEKKRTDIVHFLNERYPNGIGCEVGVLRGEFSKHLLSNWNCKKLYLVDCWEDHHEDYDELFMIITLILKL